MARIDVLEGTWEELAARADEFKGRRLRLIVLPEVKKAADITPDEMMLQETAVRLFAEADNIERAPGQTRNDARKTVFGEIVTEKYKKKGLKL